MEDKDSQRRICIHAYVTGKVQGVWYRQSAKQQALAQGVHGWAKNLSDGRVEVMLCGPENAVQSVTDWLAQGPEFAHVEQVDAQRVDYRSIEGFETY